jgi:hypothetical protein
MGRFTPRPPLPKSPKRALVFSNQASDRNYLPAIGEACRKHSIELDVMGESAGASSTEPEKTLGRYDIVFAKARCATEALAVGAAVVVCDATGLASLVTSGNLTELRRRNFGRRTLQRPVTAALIAAEIEQYNATDADRVSAAIRASESLTESTRRLVALFREVIAGSQRGAPAGVEAERLATATFLESIGPYANTFYLAGLTRENQARIDALRRDVESLRKAIPMDPLSARERGKIRLLTALGPPSTTAGATFQVVVEVENGTNRILASHPPHPVHFSYHWMSADRGEMLSFEGRRTALAPLLRPGLTQRHTVDVDACQTPGDYRLRVTLVQEKVAWFESSGRRQYVDLPIRVA